MSELVGKLIAEKYRIESLIGEADAGDLFAARNEITDTAVTVKILPQALAMDMRWAKRFIDESRSASSVNHENILNLTDFGSDVKGVCYAVFEPIVGTQLSELLTSSLDEGRAIRIAKQVASAVSAAHAKKLVHGRISPQSIFVKTDDKNTDHVKVYGFGGDPLNVERDTDPRYLAPEQTTAYPVADDRTDVYLLGITLYEMLSGVLPFEGKTAAEVQAKVSNEPPPPLSAFRKDLNPEIEPIILTAMAVNADRRYQTMAAFAEDLDLLANRIAPAKTVAASAAGSGRSVWKTAGIAFAGIAFLAVALIYATSVRQTDPTEQTQADAASFPVQPISPATGMQEESLARLAPLTEAEIMASTMDVPPGTLPGGDGYSAWANGGAAPIGAPPLGYVPLAGAPLTQGNAPPLGYVPQGGQVVTVDPSVNGGSQFMPQDGGVILVPVPVNPDTSPATKPTPAQTKPAANTAQPSATVPTQKPMATPLPKTKTDATKGRITTPPAKPKTTKPGEDEL